MTTRADSEAEVQNPLRFAYYLIKHPCRIIAIVLIVLFGACAIDYLGFAYISSTTHSYYVVSDLNVNRKDNIDLAVKYLGESSSNVAPKTTEMSRYTLLMMYKTRDSTNLLQPSNIADYIHYINTTNNKIPHTSYDDYYSLCLADKTDPFTTYPDCSSSSVWDPIVQTFQHYDTITQDDIDVFIQSHLNNPYTKDAFLQCFEEGFEETNSTSYYRAFYRFGLPYPDIDDQTSSFKDANDRKEEQDIYYDEYLFPIYQDIQIHENNHENVEIVILGSHLRNLQRQDLTYAGVLFAAGSILTVFLIMMWHLNSLFLSCGAILQIMCGFPLAYFVYRFIFMVTFFDTLNTLVIFLILGIGADDVFVFVDAWIQSAHFVHDKDDLIARMSFAFRRAAKAMIVTTATTFFAFMATAFSPIMPIAAFGIWAACVVAINYVMVVTLFPALLSFWYQKIRKHERCPSCFNRLKSKCSISLSCCNKKQDNSDNNDRTNNLEQNESKQKQKNVHLKVNHTETSSTSTNTSNHNDVEKRSTKPRLSFHQALENNDGKHDTRCLEKFLGSTFADFIIKIRWFVLIFVIVMVSVSSWKASQISPLTEQEKWFDEDHYMEKMFTWQQYFEGGSVTQLIKVKMVWGLKQQCDRTGVSFWEVEDYGKPNWDDTFNPASSESQLHLLNVCNSLLTNYSSMLYDTTDYFDCWIYDFIEYGEESKGLTYPFVFDDDEDVQTEKFNELINEWITTTNEGQKYVSAGQVGYVGDKLKFMFIEFTIPHSRWLPLKQKKSTFDEWENIVDELNADGTDGVNKMYQTSVIAWAWMASERGFVTSALQGIAIAMPLALMCLVLSTQNWIVSVFATSAIIGIICSEVGLMVLQGWELGISESIAIVMMIGFSVDYVVHLGMSYQECEESDLRTDKIKFSLFTMGISVVSGGLTTFGSGFWLIFPEMLFFRKFGILVMSVVSFSLFFSMVYFIAMLALFGPQGDTGNIGINKYIQKILKPLQKTCYCDCCKYICCCCGTMDNYYDDDNKNKHKKETELVVTNNNGNNKNQQILSGSEMSDDDDEDSEVP